MRVWIQFFKSDFLKEGHAAQIDLISNFENVTPMWIGSACRPSGQWGIAVIRFRKHELLS
jgi:hypothetical protein